MSAEIRGTVARVNLSAIVHNVRMFRQRIGPTVALMAVVKANGYGHGSEEVARAALEGGADLLGVAVAEEGRDLRERGLSCPIVILGASNSAEIEMALDHQLDMTLFDESAVDVITRLAGEMGVRARIHLKVDTGMGRVGVTPQAAIGRWVAKLQHPHIEWRGLMSHLAESDAESSAFTREQLGRFLDVIEELRRQDALPPLLHLANSAATMRFPGTHLNMVRIGIGLYGGETYHPAFPLRQAMTLESRVTFIKEVAPGTSIGYGRTFVSPQNLVIATVAIGYADGYRRALSNRAEVLVGGVLCPVVGRISMDQVTVALPRTLTVQVGDVVHLMGGEEGDRTLSAHQLADWADTISYEIFTGIAPRVPRIYEH